MILHASVAINFHLLPILTAAGDHTDTQRKGLAWEVGQAMMGSCNHPNTVKAMHNLAQNTDLQNLWSNAVICKVFSRFYRSYK